MQIRERPQFIHCLLYIEPICIPHSINISHDLSSVSELKKWLSQDSITCLIPAPPPSVHAMIGNIWVLVLKFSSAINYLGPCGEVTRTLEIIVHYSVDIIDPNG